MLFSQQSRIYVDVSDFAIWIVTAPHGLSFFDTCRIITLNDHDKYPTLILVFPSKNAKKTKIHKNKNSLKKILIIVISNSYKICGDFIFIENFTCTIGQKVGLKVKSLKPSLQDRELLLTWCDG